VSDNFKARITALRTPLQREPAFADLLAALDDVDEK
jgi:hypothetical protein